MGKNSEKVGIYHEETGNGAVVMLNSFQRLHSKNGWSLVNENTPEPVLRELAAKSGKNLKASSSIGDIVKILQPVSPVEVAEVAEVVDDTASDPERSDDPPTDPESSDDPPTKAKKSAGAKKASASTTRKDEQS